MGHSNHASNMLGMAGIDSFDMDMVTLSVADLVELHEVRLMMAGKDIRFIEYEDEDRLYDGKVVTALITYPLTKEQTQPFKKYPAWRCKCNEVLSSRSSVAEHSVFNREVADLGRVEVGSIPAGSSNSKENQ